MTLAGDAAEKSGIGMFGTNPIVRDVTFEVVNAASFLASVKGKSLPAIIEYVRDGAAFRLILTDSMTFINLNLAGVQCPRLSSEPSEPFSKEAKYFTELRLLNRQVNVVVEGIDDKFNTFYGRIEHPAGDIGVELLKNGLAKTADWSMVYTTMEIASLMRAAVKEAKTQNLRVWKNFIAPQVSGQKVFEGVVLEVVSGDAVIVLVGAQETPWNCEERRVYLSSIRVPRRGNRDENIGEPFAEEAKDLLRKHAAGKRCKVSVEYERVVGSGEMRKFASVTILTRKGKKNAASLLVENGYASVVRHRAEEERSEFYDELLQLETAAKDESKGIHGEQTSSPKLVIDLTSNASVAKGHLGHLQNKEGKHRAIVDYVIHGSRFRIRIPDENCVLNFALAGVSCPQGARDSFKGRPATQAEPFSKESLFFVKSAILQKDVTIFIETMDKGGTALGQLRYKKGPTDSNLAVDLVKMGFATINQFSAQYTPCGAELIAEEENAKKSKIGLWKDYSEKEIAPVAASVISNNPRSSLKIKITEIVNGGKFFYHDQANLPNVALVNEEMAKYQGEPGGIIEPRKNASCLALFDDGTGEKWFRAKILKVENSSITVRYIDFGNEETVTADKLRNAASDFKIPALAVEATVALITVPPLSKDYGTEAAMHFNDLVWEKGIFAKAHGKDADGCPMLALYLIDPDKGQEEWLNVGQALVAQGLAFCNSACDDSKLLQAQESAHAAHLRLWEYGDPRDE